MYFIKIGIICLFQIINFRVSAATIDEINQLRAEIANQSEVNVQREKELKQVENEYLEKSNTLKDLLEKEKNEIDKHQLYNKFVVYKTMSNQAINSFNELFTTVNTDKKFIQLEPTFNITVAQAYTLSDYDKRFVSFLTDIGRIRSNIDTALNETNSLLQVAQMLKDGFATLYKKTQEEIPNLINDIKHLKTKEPNLEGLIVELNKFKIMLQEVQTETLKNQDLFMQYYGKKIIEEDRKRLDQIFSEINVEKAVIDSFKATTLYLNDLPTGDYYRIEEKLNMAESFKQLIITMFRPSIVQSAKSKEIMDTHLNLFDARIAKEREVLNKVPRNQWISIIERYISSNYKSLIKIKSKFNAERLEKFLNLEKKWKLYESSKSQYDNSIAKHYILSEIHQGFREIL